MRNLKALLPKRDTLKINRVRVVTVACMLLPVAALIAVVRFVPASLTKPANAIEFWTLVAASASVLVLSITVGVGAVAWYGLRSLRLARHDMVTRATRDSRSVAMAKAEQFSQMIRGDHRIIQDELVAASIPRFTHQLQSGSPVFDDPSMYAVAKKWWGTVPSQTRDRILYFLNDVEAWAMHFTQGLADSTIVFGPCAPTYCSIVLQYAPWIVICRKEQFAGFYPNAVGLFQAWRAELDAKDLGSTTEVALRAANAAEERLAKHRVPPPIGTKLDI
jgi:hypothetical protein